MAQYMMVEYHERECPYWRIGKKHGPCNCSFKRAHDLYVPQPALRRWLRHAIKMNQAGYAIQWGKLTADIIKTLTGGKNARNRRAPH